VSALAVSGRSKLLARVPAPWIRLAGTVTLTGLGIYSLAQAVRGLICAAEASVSARPQRATCLHG
jgi:hypothetical protein